MLEQAVQEIENEDQQSQHQVVPDEIVAQLEPEAGRAPGHRQPVVARADQWNDRTTLKFDAPVMIPGTTLAPGTYTFKLLDSATHRHPAHRIYLSARYDITAFHFVRSV